MGLDMFLLAKKRASKEIIEQFRKEFPTATEENLGLSCQSVSIEFEIMYWRKANAIHGWFVKKIQNGNDDCGRYYVCDSELKELLELCKKVLAEKDASLLPPVSGFFFGSQEADEYYWEYVQKTVPSLEKILADEKIMNCDIYYTSSW